MTDALQRLVARLAGRSKATASDGGGRAAPRPPAAVPAALAAVSTVWSHRAPRRPRTRVADAANRLTSRGR